MLYCTSDTLRPQLSERVSSLTSRSLSFQFDIILASGASQKMFGFWHLKHADKWVLGNYWRQIIFFTVPLSKIFFSEQGIFFRKKNQAPPPQNIKWTVPSHHLFSVCSRSLSKARITIKKIHYRKLILVHFVLDNSLVNSIYGCMFSLQGKRAVLSITTGCSKAALSPFGLNGDVNVALWPIQVSLD